MRTVLSRFWHAAVMIILGCAVVSTAIVHVEAQGTRSLSSVGRRLDEFNNQTQKVARDELDREMQGRKPTGEERRQAEAKNAQIKRDFENLQTAYNDIVTRLKGKERLSDAYISEVTQSISENAGRLRSNIGFPVRKAEDGKPSGGAAASPPASLNGLCIGIYAFLTNAIFETPGVLNIAEAEKARDALDTIIRDSEILRHKVGKLD